MLQIYTVINDKLVGILLRARKYKLLDFEGEMLFQVGNFKKLLKFSTYKSMVFSLRDKMTMCLSFS